MSLNLYPHLILNLCWSSDVKGPPEGEGLLRPLRPVGHLPLLGRTYLRGYPAPLQQGGVPARAGWSSHVLVTKIVNQKGRTARRLTPLPTSSDPPSDVRPNLPMRIRRKIRGVSPGVRREAVPGPDAKADRHAPRARGPRGSHTGPDRRTNRRVLPAPNRGRSPACGCL